jgi:hypothetical protein
MSRKPILHPVYRMIKKSLDQSYRGINKLCMKFFISITFDIHLTTFKLSDYNSKCFKENIFFSIIKSNCSNGNRGVTITSGGDVTGCNLTPVGRGMPRAPVPFFGCGGTPHGRCSSAE